MKHHIFLAYSHRKTEYMWRVRESLMMQGFLLWTDEPIDKASPDLTPLIERAVQDAGCMVVVLSPETKNSSWINYALDEAIMRNTTIFQILLEGTPDQSVPTKLQAHTSQLIDARSDYSKGMWELAKRVRMLLDIPEIEAADQPKNLSHLFISYSRKDTHIMQQIIKSLRDADLKVWIDEEGLEPGTRSWKRGVQKAIDESSCLLVVLSPDAKQSEWVEAELDYADSQGKPIFSILVRGDKSSAVPFGYTLTQWVDIVKNDYDSEIQKLVKALHKHMS